VKHVQDERCGRCARQLRIARSACGRLCRRIPAHLDAPFGVQLPGMVTGYFRLRVSRAVLLASSCSSAKGRCTDASAAQRRESSSGYSKSEPRASHVAERLPRARDPARCGTTGRALRRSTFSRLWVPLAHDPGHLRSWQRRSLKAQVPRNATMRQVFRGASKNPNPGILFQLRCAGGGGGGFR